MFSCECLILTCLAVNFLYINMFSCECLILTCLAVNVLSVCLIKQVNFFSFIYAKGNEKL